MGRPLAAVLVMTLRRICLVLTLLSLQAPSAAEADSGSFSGIQVVSPVELRATLTATRDNCTDPLYCGWFPIVTQTPSDRPCQADDTLLILAGNRFSPGTVTTTGTFFPQRVGPTRFCVFLYYSRAYHLVGETPYDTRALPPQLKVTFNLVGPKRVVWKPRCKSLRVMMSCNVGCYLTADATGRVFKRGYWAKVPKLSITAGPSLRAGENRIVSFRLSPALQRKLRRALKRYRSVRFKVTGYVFSEFHEKTSSLQDLAEVETSVTLLASGRGTAAHESRVGIVQAASDRSPSRRRKRRLLKRRDAPSLVFRDWGREMLRGRPANGNLDLLLQFWF
jgi:hypothetical protein